MTGAPITTGAARLRRRLRRRYNRALFGLARRAFPTDVGPGPIDGDALRRVLVMANYFVGDLVVATPAVAFLRDAAPHARIDVLVAPGSASLLEGDPRVDRVVVHDPRRGRGPLAAARAWTGLARRLRRERYDLVADFVLPHHLREGLLTAFVAGRRGARVTPHRPVRFAGLFTHRARVKGFERRYMPERLLYAVRAAVTGGRGRAADGTAAYPLSVHVSAEVAQRVDARLVDHVGGAFVALNAWASAPMRTLGEAQAAEIAAGIVVRHPGLWVALTPPPGADASAATIVRAARARLAPADATRVVAIPSSPRLPELAAVLARAALVVTPDTANVHLAAAAGRPTVALYTPLSGTKMVHWAPPGPAHRAVAVDGRRPLAELPAAAVVDAVDAVLGSARAAIAPRVVRPGAGRSHHAWSVER